MRSKRLRRSIYDADETQKDKLPSKNTDDNIEHELGYTKALLDAVGSNPSLAGMPKVKERLNMLKEVLADIEDHYVTSKDEDARVGHKSEDSSFFGYKTHIAMSGAHYNGGDGDFRRKARRSRIAGTYRAKP